MAYRSQRWGAAAALAFLGVLLVRSFRESGFAWTPELAALTVLFGILAAIFSPVLLPERFAVNRRFVFACATLLAWLDVAFIAIFVKTDAFSYVLLLYGAVIAAVFTLLALRRPKTA